MRVIVVFGSREGGTQGIAQAVGEELVAAGHQTDVLSASDARSPAGYDAVVLAGALYAWHWAGSLPAWVRRHQETLSQLPVWALSSGPLDDSASGTDLPPPSSVLRLLDRIGCHEHRTFGGRIEAGSDAAKRGMPVGDWRNLDDVRTWARDVGHKAAERGHASGDIRFRTREVVRYGLLALTAVTGVTALAGGAMLIIGRNGAEGFLSLSTLDGTPFSSFLVPGLLLFFCIGVLNAAASVLTARKSLWYEPVAVAAGLALVIWISVQMTMIEFPLLQLPYLTIGILTGAIALGLWSTRPYARHVDRRRRIQRLKQLPLVNDEA